MMLVSRDEIKKTHTNTVLSQRELVLMSVCISVAQIVLFFFLLFWNVYAIIEYPPTLIGPFEIDVKKIRLHIRVVVVVHSSIANIRFENEQNYAHCSQSGTFLSGCMLESNKYTTEIRITHLISGKK